MALEMAKEFAIELCAVTCSDWKLNRRRFQYLGHGSDCAVNTAAKERCVDQPYLAGMAWLAEDSL
jgi:hypothetical protein